MTLSIIIPVYNEERTIYELLSSIVKLKIKKVRKEIIIIDDCSSDDTSSIIKNFLKLNNNIKYLKHKKNMGKGAAVRSGIKVSTGDYILIQDADLEYNPENIESLLMPIVSKKSEIVYGTRLKRLPNFFKDERTVRFFIHYAGNKLISLMTSLLFFQWITDVETGYKIFRRIIIKDLKLVSNGFEFEVEITAKLLKNGYKIVEIPIKTYPRDYSQGKKLQTVRDGLLAVYSLIRFKLSD